jgi:hypothetical protein
LFRQIQGIDALPEIRNLANVEIDAKAVPQLDRYKFPIETKIRRSV